MKNSEEMVNSLLMRREQYIIERKRKREEITRAVTAMCCVGFFAFMVIGILPGGWFGEELPATHNNGGEILKEDDNQDLNGGGDVHWGGDVQDYDSNYNEEIGQDEWQGKTIFEYDTNATTSYEAPENNSYGMSEPLRMAIEEHGDDVRYKVFVDLFRDKEQVDSYKESGDISDLEILEGEVERLLGLGYDAFIDIEYTGEFIVDAYRSEENVYRFAIKATKEQLENFDCSEEYGYFLFGWSERVESIISYEKDEWLGKTLLEYEIISDTTYSVPENNSCEMSESLKNAMDTFGDKVKYKVYVNIFNNKVQLNTGMSSDDLQVIKDEIYRLSDLGYETGFEECYRDGQKRYYFTLEATKEQLESFACGEEYGYMVHGWNEIMK